MLNFKEIKDAIEKHFTEMTDKYDYLYAINLDKDELWELYMNAIPPQHNKIYRVRREHDCSCCRHFIKQIGAVIGTKKRRENQRILEIMADKKDAALKEKSIEELQEMLSDDDDEEE